MTRLLTAYLCAVLSTYSMAAVLLSQFNLARISELGYTIALGQRWNTSVQDLISMLAGYLPLISLVLLIAFVFTSLLLLRFINRSAVVFILAGFVAILTIHLMINSIFGITAFAPTRSLFGLLAQGCAGGLGGYVFYRLNYGLKRTL